MENGLLANRIECPECGIEYRHALDCSQAISVEPQSYNCKEGVTGMKLIWRLTNYCQSKI
jgi:hypothetical protein